MPISGFGMDFLNNLSTAHFNIELYPWIYAYICAKHFDFGAEGFQEPVQKA